MPVGQTVELGCFTIVGATPAGAIAAALVGNTGFGGHAADCLSSADLSAPVNFSFFTPTAAAFTTGPASGGSKSATACLAVGGLLNRSS